TDKIAMIEGFAREVSEEEMAASIEFGHGVIREIIALQQEFQDKVGTIKAEVKPFNDGGLFDRLKEKYFGELRSAKQTVGKLARAEAVKMVKDRALAEFIPDPAAEGAFTAPQFATAWHDLTEMVVR